MGAAELLAVSLALSVLLAGLAFVWVRAFDALCPDPWLRERAWTIAFHAPAVSMVLIAMALLAAPPRVREVAENPGTGTSTVTDVVVAPGVFRDLPGETLATTVLACAGLLAAVRALGLMRRMMRLRRLVGQSRPVPPAALDTVRTVARDLGVPMPDVRVHDNATEAMVAGLVRPVLILPAVLAEHTDPRTLLVVCAHELAHLKRGDQRALWIEEATLILLAFNPVLPVIRDHRAAAREEACDAVALTLVGSEVRPLFARALLDALRASPIGRHVPALTFTSSRRIFAMRRLKAILSPVPPSDIRLRLGVLGLGVAIATVAGAGSFALAAQRQPLPATLVTATAAAAVAVTLPVPAVVPAYVPEMPANRVVRLEAIDSAEAGDASEAAAEPAPGVVQTAAPTREPITNPSWVERPTPNWPAAAIDQGTTNAVVAVSCLPASDGRLVDCRIVSEDPAGLGFGAAALEAAHRGRVSPRTVAGVATAGRINFNVRMQLAE